MTQPLPDTIDLDADDRMERPVTRLCYLALKEAILTGVGEIRMPVPDHEGGLIEYRQDGAWKPVMKIPLAARQPMIERYEFMAGVEPGSRAERRGHMRIKLRERIHAITLSERLETDGPVELRLQIDAAT